SGPRFAFATPLGTGLAALGIVGILVASGGLASGGASSVRDTGNPAAAPELAPAPGAANMSAAKAASEAAASEAPAMLAAPSADAQTGLSQKTAPDDGAAGAAPADGTLTADATADAGSSPLVPLSVAVVFVGCALLAARLVARRLARAP
ncbi:MAG TPA: hypothetical protein VFQ75_09435, partial [Candidatus Limnocylindrales bacterium]|nr:hypothetical protein [Candidatus Limnocylindrales bacterium]